MYRPRSTGLWFNAPGVVAAYQPIAAPDAFAARQNVARNGARFGVYTATGGVAPTWSGAVGWTGNGTSQYLTTGITPAAGWSLLVAFDGVALSANRCVAGSSGTGDTRLMLHATHSSFSGGVLYGQGAFVTATPGLSSGVLGVTGQSGYRNGKLDTGAIATWSGTGFPLFLLARNSSGGPSEFFSGSLRAVLVTNRTLLPVEMWYYSRQMAYCHVNQDWSAWGRRRQYFYAPSQVVGFQAAWAARQNRLIGGGSS